MKQYSFLTEADNDKYTLGKFGKRIGIGAGVGGVLGGALAYSARDRVSHAQKISNTQKSISAARRDVFKINSSKIIPAITQLIEFVRTCKPEHLNIQSVPQSIKRSVYTYGWDISWIFETPDYSDEPLSREEIVSELREQLGWLHAQLTGLSESLEELRRLQLMKPEEYEKGRRSRNLQGIKNTAIGFGTVGAGVAGFSGLRKF